jgi:HAD superfamily hydrolase (TIGR01509 family)
MIDLTRIKAITLDLDDTLWPIWPTIARAEEALLGWLAENAPRTAALCATPGLQRQVREQMPLLRPDLASDMSALRREAIRILLGRAGESTDLAEIAFDFFLEQRQKVVLFADVLPALDFLQARYPLVSVSNGNADIHKVGLGKYFTAALSAHQMGIAKPDVRIFHAGAQAAGVLPHEVLQIGDDAHLDSNGGLDAGMQVVWVNREAHVWSHADKQPHLEVPDLHALCAHWPEYQPS